LYLITATQLDFFRGISDTKQVCRGAPGLATSILPEGCNQILRAVGFSFLKWTGMEALSYGQGIQQGLSQLQTVPNTITCLRAAGVALRAVQV